MIKQLIIILLLAGIGYYGYGYYKENYATSQSIEDLCLVNNSKDFTQFENNDYKLYLYRDFQLASLNGVNLDNQKYFTTFKVSDNPQEGIFIWKRGYAFDSNKLVYDGVSVIDNYTILNESDVIGQYKNDYKRLMVQYNYNDLTIIQDSYALVKDNVGYLITLRSINNNYDVLKPRFDKIVCSFTN